MDKIEKIRQEIERLKGICMAQIKTNPGQAFPFVMEMTGYDKLLSFLKTLAEEPDKSLEEVAENYIAPIENDEGLDYINFNGRDIKDAFIAGWKCRDDQMPMPEDTVLFNKGVAEGRRLERKDMLKDAVEVTVQSPLLGPPMVCCIANGCSDGDKVRIVVLKEEE